MTRKQPPLYEKLLNFFSRVRSRTSTLPVCLPATFTNNTHKTGTVSYHANRAERRAAARASRRVR